MITRNGSYLTLFKIFEDYENPSSLASKPTPFEILQRRITRLKVNILNSSSKPFKTEALPYIKEFISSAVNWEELSDSYFVLANDPDFEFIKIQRFSTLQPEFTDTWKEVIRFIARKMDELFLTMLKEPLDPAFIKLPALKNILADDTNQKEYKTLEIQSRLLVAWEENEFFPKMWKAVCKKLTNTRLHPALLMQNLHGLPNVTQHFLSPLHYLKAIRLHQSLTGTADANLKSLAESAFLPIVKCIHAVAESKNELDLIKKMLKDDEFNFLKANNAFDEIMAEIENPFKNLKKHYEKKKQFSSNSNHLQSDQNIELDVMSFKPL